jgi:hypothetical protein
MVPDRRNDPGSQTGKSAPALTVALGLTVAMIFVVGPAHPFAKGVMVYVTFPTEAFVVVSNWLMVDPLPFVAPVIFALGKAVHENVVPATFFGVGLMERNAVWPLHIVKSDPEAEGKGFTVTTRSAGRPLQPPFFGVM